MLIIIITFLIFVVRFSFIFISLASIFLFIVLPIKGIVSFDSTEYTKILYVFPVVALFQGYFTLVYIFNNIYLKKFDNIYFDKIYTYLDSKQDYDLQKELLSSFKEKVSNNFILVSIFKYGILNYFLDIFSNIFLLGIRRGWARYSNFAWYFGRKSFRITFLYGWLFILKPELFKDENKCKPIKVITYSSLLVSLVSILFLMFLVASIVFGGILVFLNKLV
ncbi:hypothetical protein Q1H02_02950 [Francisella tularensis subsp. mediasiatica]|nr:hypothetical protein [Francisella tularensis]WKL72583.1 hypothetical protein Q1H03_00835 [Francisella tularensis subsp. mediasiatica]WKL73622.1 hypothetical protein Q1H01_06920 [Francisella tularensis subsp. mediasiatica]WKL79524.1 hypothetical protein Q1H02_02950 [Francisella tularensis subsp. mediasiatica]WKL81247.1 hypothetical protein Q1G99_03395 [Francisella tularensis subsp. mediasiatica]